jgi:hypothetical protein
MQTKNMKIKSEINLLKNNNQSPSKQRINSPNLKTISEYSPYKQTVTNYSPIKI